MEKELVKTLNTIIEEENKDKTKKKMK